MDLKRAKKDLKKFVKGIDKRDKMCYNKSIRKLDKALKDFHKRIKKSY